MKKNHSIFARAFIAASLSAVLSGAGTAFAADEVLITDINPALAPLLCQDSQKEIQHIDVSQFESRSADEFYKNDFGGRQFYLFGDGNHYDHLRVAAAFYSPDHLDDMAAAHFKHILIERDPHVSQKGMDDLVSSAITPEQFATDYVGGKMWERQGNDQCPKDANESEDSHESRVQFARGVVYGAQKGIAVDAIDVKTKGIATKQEREELYHFFGSMTQAFEELCPCQNGITGRFNGYFMRLNKDYLTDARLRRFGEIMQERYNDTGRTVYAKAKVGDEKTAIRFGNAHFSGPKSFKTLLGEENVVHIVTFANEEALDKYGLDPAEGIDFIHLLDTDRYYKVGDIDFAPLTTPKAGPKPVP